MKKWGSRFERLESKEEELMNVYREILEREDYPIRIKNVMAKLASHRTKCFWVSTQRAFNVISKMKKGLQVEIRNPNKMAMFEEIFRRVEKYERMYPELGLHDIVGMVVCTEAPSFYMTPQSAAVIMHRIRNKWKRGR